MTTGTRSAAPRTASPSRSCAWTTPAGGRSPTSAGGCGAWPAPGARPGCSSSTTSASWPPPKAESRQQAVAELARQVKGIAREFGIPVILLAQLNRGRESPLGQAPAMSDLRESGEIEQSADIVILLHREDAYDPKRRGRVRST